MIHGVKDLLALAASLSLLVLGACSDDSSTTDRASVPTGDGGGADGGKDAGLTEAGVDPTGGRDSEPASCFASCQNTAFTCQAKGPGGTAVSEAQMSGDSTGCVGSVKDVCGGDPVAMKIDCTNAQVCVGGAPGTTPTDCVPATFSAFNFAYTPTGGVQTICNRN